MSLLQRRNHRRAGALGERDQVRDMIAMAVRDEDEVSVNFVDINLRCERVGSNKRIEEEVVPPASTAKQACP